MVFRQVSVCVWAFIICTTWLRDGRRTHSHLLPRLAAFAFSVQPFWLWFLWLLLFFVGFAVFAWLSHSNLLEVGSYFFLHCHHAPQQNGSGWSSTCRNMSQHGTQVPMDARSLTQSKAWTACLQLGAPTRLWGRNQNDFEPGPTKASQTWPRSIWHHITVTY